MYLLNHHNSIADDVLRRDLCLLRENNIVVDNQDLASSESELTFMIDLLCALYYHCHKICILVLPGVKPTPFSSILQQL